ncbi:family 16 glycoside hydrolase [uncultured Gimesia sp.]|uniref:family 16 glycoside hydrolase n=1 Tax=uncultured Gimesia sp. TaxID=1678688 RepID=UPI0030D8F136|tara:strand:- start:180547 stop:181185 length:639 start_codon:yes stop_codon:yes gene_type:complete
MQKQAACLCLALTFLVPTLLKAEKNADLKPVLTKIDKPTQTETFDGKKLGKQWAANKGEWTITDGVLTGKELKADKHAAVLTWKLPHRNSALRCSFQLKDAKFFHVSLNHPQGHLFRIMIDQKGMTLRTDKNKKDPQSKPITLAQAKAKIDPVKWYTLQLEMQGDKVVAQIDNGLKVEGQHPSLDSKKTGYRFIMKGNALLLDDLTAWNLDD